MCFCFFVHKKLHLNIILIICNSEHKNCLLRVDKYELPAGYADNNSRSSKPIAGTGRGEMRPTGIQQDRSLKEGIVDANLKSKLPPERAEDKPSNSGLRPKGDDFQ